MTHVTISEFSATQHSNKKNVIKISNVGQIRALRLIFLSEFFCGYCLDVYLSVFKRKGLVWMTIISYQFKSSKLA